MELYKKQSYESYMAAQTNANLKKINNVWVQREDIEKIHQVVETAESIICHGTRRGVEQQYFKEFYPNAYIIGTEISHTAKKFPNTIQHDFHEVKSEWVEKFDILYSNSFDHTYDPNKCLDVWTQQIKPNGYIVIDFSLRKNVNPVDCLYLSSTEAVDLMKTKNIDVIETYNTNQNSFMFIGKKI